MEENKRIDRIIVTALFFTLGFMTASIIWGKGNNDPRVLLAMFGLGAITGMAGYLLTVLVQTFTVTRR